MCRYKIIRKKSDLFCLDARGREHSGKFFDQSEDEDGLRFKVALCIHGSIHCEMK